MAWDVHLSVVFSCNKNDGVGRLARKHLESLPETSDEIEDLDEARWFLEDLSKRTGNNPGPKGGLSMWGTVGNYTTGKGFVGTLRPFWEELLRGVDGGPLDFEHIIVFCETEQSEQAQAFEIGLEEGKEDGSNRGPLFIRHHEDLPFAWMQF
jgi:hypothetical protein